MTTVSLSYSSCGSGDITILFCLVTLRDHMIKGTYGFVSGSPVN